MTEGRVHGEVAMATGGAVGIAAEICRVLTAQLILAVHPRMNRHPEQAF
ncbi:hypothetical protein ACFU9X_34215 [Streptomyces atratus]